MRTSAVAAALVLGSLSALVQADPPQKPQTDEPTGFLEVERVVVFTTPATVFFDHRRPYAISINKHLSHADAARTKLAGILKDRKQLDHVVFEWFGTEPPKQLNIAIGKKVPIQIVQAVIATFAASSEVPVHLALLTEDGRLGQAHRVYVGALLPLTKEPTTPDQIKELLKPDLTAEQLAKLLPKAGD